MLQNPSKYHHPNALSHFLALRHQSQAAQANQLQALHAGLPTANSIAESQYYVQNQHHDQRQHHQQQHHDQPQQQHQQQQEQSNHQQSQHVIMGNHYHSHHQKHFGHHQLDLMDGNTSIDAGKSFTIAAILGLQKNAAAVVAAENNSRRDYNSVINLSLNNSNNNNNNANSSINDMLPDGSSDQTAYDRMKNGGNGLTNDTGSDETHRNVNNVNTISIDSPSTVAAVTTSGLQTYNCDSINNINRFLPAPNKSSSTTTATGFGGLPGVVLNPHAQKSATTAQMRVNSFAAAAAAAAAAVNIGSGASSALQSLQQLHQQHHAQHTNLSFQRERQKREDNNSKKATLKNKRVRTIFTPEQLERLESEFERQQYMVGPERLYLAHTLQLTEAQVKVWFQNRRIKWRKHHLEITQQRLAMLRQTHLNVTPAPHRISATTTPTQCSDDLENLKNNENIGDIVCESRQASESDLSICNDSNDNESYADAEET